MNKKAILTGTSIACVAMLSYYSPSSSKLEYSLADSTKPENSSTNTASTESSSLTKSLKFPVKQNSETAIPYIPPKKNAYHSPKFGPLAHSLRGTSIPAYFELDASGNLIVTPSIKSLIEYFLSAQGEESLETAIGRIEEYLQTHLKEPATTQAIHVLTEYIQYKEALIDLETTTADNSKDSKNDYTQLFAQRKEVRQNNLSPAVYDAFFSEEDKLDGYTTEVLSLQRLGKLDELNSTETHNKLIELLPNSERKVKEKELKRIKISEAKDNGASDEELFQLREEAFGFEAAERYALADKKQSEWNHRYQQYRSLRESIRKNKGLTDYDKEKEIVDLQASLFDQYERKRLTTLDKLTDKQETL